MSELERVAKIMDWRERRDEEGYLFMASVTELSPMMTWVHTLQDSWRWYLTDSGLVAIENRLFEVEFQLHKSEGRWAWHNTGYHDTREAAAIAALLSLSQPEAE